MENKSDSLYIVIPAYNEEDTIHTVLTQWYPMIENLIDSRLIIIDDGSTDGTYDRIMTFQKTHPKITIIRTKNQGHGRAILTGYRYAIQHNASYIFQTDSDGQTHPNTFPILWDHRRQYALSIGYRKHRKDGYSRRFVTRILRILLFLNFGRWIPDANCQYRLMEGQSLKKIINQLPNNCDLTNVYIAAAYMQIPTCVHSYEIPFAKRQGGTNSIQMRQVLQIGFRNLYGLWTFRNQLKQEREQKHETL